MRAGVAADGVWPARATIPGTVAELQGQAEQLAEALASGDADAAERAVAHLARARAPLRLVPRARQHAPPTPTPQASAKASDEEARRVPAAAAATVPGGVSPPDVLDCGAPPVAPMPSPPRKKSDENAPPILIRRATAKDAQPLIQRQKTLLEEAEDPVHLPFADKRQLYEGSEPVSSPSASGAAAPDGRAVGDAQQPPAAAASVPTIDLTHAPAVASKQRAAPEQVSSANATPVGAQAPKANLPTPAAAQEAARLPIGSLAEYYSTSYGGWVHAVVQGFNEATGNYVLDIQPVALPSKVRPQTQPKPSPATEENKTPSSAAARSPSAAMPSPAPKNEAREGPPAHSGQHGAARTPAPAPRREEREATPAQSGQPVRFAPGSNVEYYSRSHGTWVYGVVQGFDESTGTYRLDIHPQAAPEKIRPASTPQPAPMTPPAQVAAAPCSKGGMVNESKGGMVNGSKPAAPAAADVVPPHGLGRHQRQCGQCQASFPVDEMVGPNCEHLFCQPCLRRYVLAADFLKQRLTCPCCTTGLTPLQVQHIVGDQMFAQRQAKLRQEDEELARRLLEEEAATAAPPAGQQAAAAAGPQKQHMLGAALHRVGFDGAPRVGQQAGIGYPGAGSPGLQLHGRDGGRARPDPIGSVGSSNAPASPAHQASPARRVGSNPFNPFRPEAGGRPAQYEAAFLNACQEAAKGYPPESKASLPPASHGLPQSPCEICNAKCSLDELLGPADCGHLFCSACLRKEVGAKDFIREAVHCPKPGCPVIVESAQVRHLVGEEFFFQRQREVDEEAARALAEEIAREDADAQAQQAQIPGFDCPLCIERYTIDQGIELDCKHSLCVECFKNYLESKIKEAQVAEDELICPIPKCKREITVAQVEGAMAGSPLWDKFLHFRMNLWRPTDEEGRIVECPTPDCNRFLVPPGDDFVRCPRCRVEFCPKCGSKEHKGVTCEQYRAWQAQNANVDQNFEELMAAEQWRRCPACSAPSERESGCNFMQCRSENCRKRTYWCYVCGLQLRKEDHYSHYPRGPYEDECHTPVKDRLPAGAGFAPRPHLAAAAGAGMVAAAEGVQSVFRAGYAWFAGPEGHA